MDEKTLKKMLENSKWKENQNIEFKRALSLCTKKEKAELSKDVAAMANNDNGGAILIGMDDKGQPCGIAVSAFPVDTIYQIIGDRCCPLAFKPSCEIVSLSCKGKSYNIGIISVSGSSIKPVRCLDERGRWRAPKRVGNQTTWLELGDIPPPFLPVNLKKMAVYNIDFTKQEPYIKWETKPFERIASSTTPSVPVPITFIPQFGKGHPALTSWCGTIDGSDWLSTLKRVEKKIHQQHGIIAQTWTIRNNELIAPLPEKMPYITGPSIRCLERTMNKLQIRKYAYLAYIIIGYKQLVYVISGQINNLLDFHIYTPYVPKSKQFVSVDSNDVKLKEQNLWFTQIQCNNILSFSGVDYWSAYHPTKKELNSLPSARIVSYMGSPKPKSAFKIKGFHVLKINNNVKEIIKCEGGKYGEIFSTVKPSLLPCYVSSKLVKKEKEKIRLTSLSMKVQLFSNFVPGVDVHLIGINAGIYQT